MLWIYKIYERVKPRNSLFSICLSIIISCGGIIILFLPALFTRTYIWRSFTIRMWSGCILGFFWIILSPHLIVKYIKKTNTFFDMCIKRSENNYIVKKLKYNFENNHFNNFKFYLFSLIWISIVLTPLVIDSSYLEKYGMMGWDDIYFIIFLLCLIYILYLTSIGLYAIISTLYFVLIIIKSHILNIDFYVQNIREELHFVIEYVFSALKIITTGMLFLPIILDYIEFTRNNLLKILAYIAIVIYSFSLFVTLFVPLKEVSLYFNVAKEKELKKLNMKYRNIAKKLTVNRNKINTHDFIEYYILNSHIKNIENSSIINISLTKCLEFTAVIILPIISLIFNQSDIKNLLSTLFSGK